MADYLSDKSIGSRGKSARVKFAEFSKSYAPAFEAGASVFGGVYQPVEIERWGSFPCWAAFEAACVTCGFDPQPLLGADRKALQTQPVALSEIDYRISLFQRSIRMQIIGENITPVEALQILNDRDRWYPSKLQETVLKIAQSDRRKALASDVLAANSEANDNRSSDAENDCRFTSKSGRAKVIKLYQRMLLSLSLEYLNLVPERPQNPTAKLILKAMARHFKDLPNEDTVRDHIGFWVNDQLER